MAIVKWHRTFEAAEEASQQSGFYDLRLQWVVETNNKFDNLATILESVQAPQPGDPHPYAPTSRLLRRDARRLTPFVWLFTAEYTTSTDRDETGNPVNRLLLPSFSTVRASRVASLAYAITRSDGAIPANLGGAREQPILNSAGQPFSEPIEDEERMTLVRYQRYFSAYSPGTYPEGVLNDGTIQIGNTSIAKYRALLDEVTAEPERISWTDTDNVQQTDWYYLLTFYILINRESEFSRDVLDVGLSELVDGKARDIRDSNGEPVREPWPLDGNGKALTATQVSNGDHRYRRVWIHGATSFTNLGLDQIPTGKA